MHLRSVHTPSFPALLNHMKSSLLVTTYQADKLVVIRADGNKINTHFRTYNHPMGLAVDRGRLAIGTMIAIEQHRNMPEVASRLQPPGRYDAVYVPRSGHLTGNIDIHDLAWAGDELWLVNTRFSCLCTLDNNHSFVPRWRPPFITAYAPEDRCHLNGLAVVDGRPRYVTALGTTDSAEGWRDNKLKGGVILDVESGEPVATGLCMPHSPRWHQKRLWVLESGTGTLAAVDLGSGRLEVTARLPGYTRGLDFLGPYAFVGLSQVRDSAVLTDAGLLRALDGRQCGIWVVDLRTGEPAAFLRFENAIQELFAVAALPSIRCPEVLTAADKVVEVAYHLPRGSI